MAKTVRRITPASEESIGFEQNGWTRRDHGAVTRSETTSWLNSRDWSSRKFVRRRTRFDPSVRDHACSIERLNRL